MKILNWGIVLLLLLLAVIATVSIVSAKEDANEYELVEVDSVGVIDVNSIKLPPLHFDNSQEKVIVNGELNPSEEKKLSLIYQTASSSQTQIGEKSISKIPFGSIIHHSQDGVTTIFDSTGMQLFVAEDSKAETIATPSGLKPATFVHEVPSGSIIQTKDNKAYVIHQKRLILTIIIENNQNNITTKRISFIPGIDDKWIEWVRALPSERIGEFTVTWTVPPAPIKTRTDYPTGRTSMIFLWSGVGNRNGVIQPVLAWHFAERSSTPRPLAWTGAAWAAWGNNEAIHSPQINVATGHDITGYMRWDKVQKMWYIKFTDQNTHEITNLYSGIISNTGVYLYPGVLEGYETQPGNDYLPGDTTFSNFIIKSEDEKYLTPAIERPEYQNTLIKKYELIKGQNGLFVDVDSWPNKVILYTHYTPPTFTIVPNAGSHGTITPSTPTEVPAGGSQTFTISPDPGYVIDDVKINKQSVGAVTSYTFENVQKDSSIRATFKRQITYSINPTTGPHGTISPSKNVKVLPGGSQTFTISANTGYVISDVLVDGASVGAVNSYTFEKVQANHRIRATFKSSPSTFTITSVAGSGGSINPLGAVTVPAGGSQTYTITPNSGYMITEVSVDGLPQGAISTYTFNNVQADHTISSSFKPASVSGTDWIWSRDGWGDWKTDAKWGGYVVGENSEYGPVMVNDPIEGIYGEHGTITHLNRGWIEASVWRTFTDTSGSGWNTIIFNGVLGATDVPEGRWMTIDVNGQQVFAANELQTPPGNTGQIFEIKVSFPQTQTQTATVKITQGQNPAWGPLFLMKFYSVKLSNENTVMMKTESVPFVIPDGSGLVTNATAPQ